MLTPPGVEVPESMDCAEAHRLAPSKLYALADLYLWVSSRCSGTSPVQPIDLRWISVSGAVPERPQHAIPVNVASGSALEMASGNIFPRY